MAKIQLVNLDVAESSELRREEPWELRRRREPLLPLFRGSKSESLLIR